MHRHCGGAAEICHCVTSHPVLCPGSSPGLLPLFLSFVCGSALARPCRASFSSPLSGFGGLVPRASRLLDFCADPPCPGVLLACRQLLQHCSCQSVCIFPLRRVITILAAQAEQTSAHVEHQIVCTLLLLRFRWRLSHSVPLRRFGSNPAAITWAVSHSLRPHNTLQST